MASSKEEEAFSSVVWSLAILGSQYWNVHLLSDIRVLLSAGKTQFTSVWPDLIGAEAVFVDEDDGFEEEELL